MIDRLLIAALRGYKRWISPMLGQRCRFVPTCSEYSMAAIEHFGAVKGSWLTVKRLSRCHPLHPGGYDPIPSQRIPSQRIPSQSIPGTADAAAACAHGCPGASQKPFSENAGKPQNHPHQDRPD